MGRRYQYEVSKRKDNITYHVHNVTGEILKKFDNKKEAVAFSDTVVGSYITKTRTQVSLDKNVEV